MAGILLNELKDKILASLLLLLFLSIKHTLGLNLRLTLLGLRFSHSLPAAPGTPTPEPVWRRRHVAQSKAPASPQ